MNVIMTEKTITMPDGLHPDTADLVARFASALAEKLHKAEQKYGYSDGWLDPGWMEECQQKLAHHVQKGDSRDVAAYCAFMWHHGWSTVVPHTAVAEDIKQRDIIERAFKLSCRMIESEPGMKFTAEHRFDLFLTIWDAMKRDAFRTNQKAGDAGDHATGAA